MKTILTLLLLISLISCNYSRWTGGERPSACVINFGAQQHIDDFVAGDIAVVGFHSDSLEGWKYTLDTVKKMYQAYLLEQAITEIAGYYYTHQGAKVASSQALGLQKLKNAKSVADAKAQLSVLKEANRSAEALAPLARPEILPALPVR